MSTTEGRETDPLKRPQAVVVGVQFAAVSEQEHASSLEELERLASTLGLQTVGRVTQRRAHLAANTVLGEGKLRELAEWTGGTGVVPSGAVRKKRRIDGDDADADADADGNGDGDKVDNGERPDEASQAAAATDDDDGEALPATASEDAPAARATVVLVDHDLSPSQARNLERATGVEVLDRTSWILAIFQRHARTREARLQVEIARLAYQSPRLRMSGGADRQRGGVGGKGAGESSIELDRRKIRDRIAELRQELANIEREAGVRRKRRSDAATVALVGYTNAGKSTLFNALTHPSAGAYVADKLFATLDTTTRKVWVEGAGQVVVADTVGFIRDLPHGLVAAFRATLEETLRADLLLHVVDSSSPGRTREAEDVNKVLAEIGAEAIPQLAAWNKIDSSGLQEGVERDEYGRISRVLVSAKTGAGLAGLRGAIAEAAGPQKQAAGWPPSPELSLPSNLSSEPSF